MCVSTWFDFFDGLFRYQVLLYICIWGKCDNKEGGLNWAHPFHRVLKDKRGSNITEVRHYSNFRLINIGNRSTYAVNMGWKRIPSLKIYSNFKSWKQLAIFLLNYINFHRCEKSPQYHTCTTHAKLLKLTEIGLSPLDEYPCKLCLLGESFYSKWTRRTHC